MRLLNRTFFCLFLIIALSLIGSVALAYYYQDDIEQLVVEKINDALESSIEISKVEISVIRNFPFTSIKLIDVVAFDRFKKDTLLKSENITLKFNALDIYHENYQIQEIDINSGFAYVYLKDGIGNYEIWKTSKDSSSNKEMQFGIESIKMKDFELKYKQQDLIVQLYSINSELNLSISDNKISLNLDGNFNSENLLINQVPYLINKEQFEVKATYTIIDKEHKIKGGVNIADESFDIDFLKNKAKTNLIANTLGANIKNLLSITPKRYINSIKKYDINCKADVQFQLDSDKLSDGSSISTSFQLNNASIQGDIPIDIKQGSIKGVYSNGKNKDLSTSTIVMSNISCMANSEKVNGNATLSNFKNLNVKTNLTSKIQLANLRQYGINYNAEKLSGLANFNIDYNGKVGLNSKLEYDIAVAKKQVMLTFENINYQQSSSSPEIKNGRVELRLSNDLLVIDSLNCSIGEKNKLQYNGAIENVFGHFLLKNATLKIGGDLYSDWIFIDELLNPDTTATSANNTTIELPEDVIANINTTVVDFTFDRFHMRSFYSKLSYINKTFKVKDIELETMSGKITGNLTFEQVENGKLRLISTSNMEEINVRQLFYEFRNFGQTTMRHKHLRGTISSDIYLRNEWDKYLNPITENLYCFIDLKIDNGQLIKFEPMMLMSDYISVNELKKIKFSTLENQIEIKKERVEIPFMEIHSSAIDIAGSGSHSFNNEIDYEFKILLDEIISGKLKRKKNKKEVSVFEEVVQDDGVKGITMFLKMEGTIDDPKISHNTIRLRSSLKEGFKNEKKELKEILKNEFDGNTETENEGLINNPDYDNIIEWEN